MQKNNDKHRRTFYFDLDSKKLREQFGWNGRYKGYRQIKRFMKNNQFTHRQKSGYHSINELDDTQVTDLIKRLRQELPWISKCALVCDVANISQLYDVMPIMTEENIEKEYDLSEFEVDIEKKVEEKSSISSSISHSILEAAHKAEQYNSSHKQNSHFKNEEEIVK